MPIPDDPSVQANQNKEKYKAEKKVWDGFMIQITEVAAVLLFTALPTALGCPTFPCPIAYPNLIAYVVTLPTTVAVLNCMPGAGSRLSAEPGFWRENTQDFLPILDAGTKGTTGTGLSITQTSRWADLGAGHFDALTPLMGGAHARPAARVLS